jgi:hypothetical protein
VLDLSYNQLSGELPGFNFVYDLQVLKLSNNRFTGVVPNGLIKGDSLVLSELDLSGNNLSGNSTATTVFFVNIKYGLPFNYKVFSVVYCGYSCLSCFCMPLTLKFFSQDQ